MKFLLIVTGIFLISYQQNACKAFSISPSSVISFGKFLYEIKNKLMERDAGISDTMLLLQEIRGDLKSGLQTIEQSLKNISDVTDHVIKINVLEHHFRSLDNIFKRVVQERREIIKNPNPNRFNDSLYIKPWIEKVSTVQKDFDSIADILTGHTTVFYLSKNFNTNLKQFEDVCKTKLSHQQLLDTLFGNYRVAAAEYYLTISFIYDIVKGPENYQKERVKLYTQMRDSYTWDVHRYKNLMVNASTELYSCDPDKQIEGSTYSELQLYSNYFLRQDFHSKNEKNCKSDGCANLQGAFKCKYGFCKYFRECPGKLVNCQQFTNLRQSARVCMNTSPTETRRYKSIVMKEEIADKYTCEAKYDHSISKMDYSYPGAIFGYTCYYCNCMCEEKKYFISRYVAEANVYKNRVVTGARLVQNDNYLVIQIQQGQLGPNGTINASTVEWQPIDYITRVYVAEVSWNEVREIALNAVKLTEGRVLTGLGFDANDHRAWLRVRSEKFDFRTGEVKPDPTTSWRTDQEIFNPGKNKLECNNCDVPTKATMENKPVSNDDQYLEFRTSSLEKDGGQTTIPFIDTQDVAPIKPVPLSGAGLFIRGQEGFGGFLNLKLFTYNIVNYISDEFELMQDFHTEK